jgi:hypothetical protein
MDDPTRYGAGRDRRLTLAAIVALSLAIAGIAYRYSDDLIDLVRSVTIGATSRPQGRLHY